MDGELKFFVFLICLGRNAPTFLETKISFLADEKDVVGDEK